MGDTCAAVITVVFGHALLNGYLIQLYAGIDSTNTELMSKFIIDTV